MLSPTILGARPPSPITTLNTHSIDHLFALSFNRYRGTLFVVSPDDISLIDSCYASPGQNLSLHIQFLENMAFDALKNVQPILCLAAKQNLRQRYESISRISNVNTLSLDRYYSPSEKMLLHRYLMALIRRTKSANWFQERSKP